MIFIYLLKFYIFRKLKISNKYLIVISKLIELGIVSSANKINKIQFQDIEFDAPLKIAALFEKYGLHDEVKVFHQIYSKKIDNLSSSLSLKMRNTRLFTEKWFSPIGHTALIDVYIKAEMLGIIPRKKNLLILNNGYSNKTLINYMGKYIKLSEASVESFHINSDLIEENLTTIKNVTGYSFSLYEFCSEVQILWEKKQNAPLFKLDDQHIEEGYKAIKKLGFKNDSWFCGLHVRSTDSDSDSIRNADINTYRKALKEVQQRGGVTINIGSGNNESDSIKEDGLIEYATSEFKSDWMDVFLLGEGKFLIATGSGPSVVPISFGRPVVLTNWGPLSARHCSISDILLPKHYWISDECRYMSFKERMSSQYGYIDSVNIINKKNISVEDNTPEEISSVVIEMYDSIFITSHDQVLDCGAIEDFKNISIQQKLYPVKLANIYIQSMKY